MSPALLCVILILISILLPSHCGQALAADRFPAVQRAVRAVFFPKPWNRPGNNVAIKNGFGRRGIGV